MNRHQRRREAAAEAKGGNFVAKREAFVQASKAEERTGKLIIRHEVGCAIRRKHRCDCDPYIGWQKP